MKKQFDQTVTAQIIAKAQDLNFWGKRIRDSRLECAEQIRAELELDFEVTSLIDFLVLSKPAKAKPAKAEKVEKADKPSLSGSVQSFRSSLPVLGGDRFLIVSAQNNTAPAPIWSKILELADRCDARLVVMPVHYNKNAFSPVCEQTGSSFHDAFKPYLIEEDHWLGKAGSARLAVSASVLPTAKLPVNAGAQINAGEILTVIASPKMQYRTLERPAIAGTIRKTCTTGSATQYNYTRSRAGAEAEADHAFGCLFVSVTDQGVWQTQIEADSNGDLTFYSVPDMEVYTTRAESPQVSALILGDLHCEKKDLKVWGDTLGLCEDLRPDVIAVHDILHFSTRSHHNRNDGAHLYQTRFDEVENDLKKVASDLSKLANYCSDLYVVESNHNSALDNWLHDLSYQPKRDPINAKLYYMLNWLCCENDDSSRNALQVAFEEAENFARLLPEVGIVWGRMDHPYQVEGIDLSQHGHKGQNGSAGNPKQLASWGLPMVTGHTHSPSKYGSVVTVGVTGSLDQGYNRGGASSWDHAHAIVWSTGVVQLVNLYAQAL